MEMDTLGWIIANIVIIGGFALLVRWLMKPSRDEVEAKAKRQELDEQLYYRDFKFTHYPAEGVNGLSEMDMIKTMRKGFRSQKTGVLRVYLNQYSDMIRRIESKDPDTLNTLGPDQIDFHLELAKANLQFVQDELRRRGVNPF